MAALTTLKSEAEAEPAVLTLALAVAPAVEEEEGLASIPIWRYVRPAGRPESPPWPQNSFLAHHRFGKFFSPMLTKRGLSPLLFLRSQQPGRGNSEWHSSMFG